MFTSTWWVIAPPLLFVLSTFLTIIGLSNFYSLNPYLAVILLSMNILVALLSRSVFIVTPLCISNFFTPILIYTSLSILKILLISLWLPPSLAMLSDSLGCVPLCHMRFSLYRIRCFLFLLLLTSTLSLPILNYHLSPVLFYMTSLFSTPFILHICCYATSKFSMEDNI